MLDAKFAKGGLGQSVGAAKTGLPEGATPGGARRGCTAPDSAEVGDYPAKITDFCRVSVAQETLEGTAGP